jgi:hypothetical protein
LLTEDEVALVATAAFYGPFPPKPDYLPECERLAQRGWFVRGITEDSVVFTLSEAGKTALCLDEVVDEASRDCRSVVRSMRNASCSSVARAFWGPHGDARVRPTAGAVGVPLGDPFRTQHPLGVVVNRPSVA